MVLGIKNFNILGVHWKIWLLVGGFSKNQYRVGADGLKRGGLDSLPIQGGGGGGAWQEREPGVLLRGRGVWYPNAHYEFPIQILVIFPITTRFWPTVGRYEGDFTTFLVLIFF